MKTIQILLLEDKIEEAQKVIGLLSLEYSITYVNTLEKAIYSLENAQFDFAIVDIDINGKFDGIELAKHIQKMPNPIPFLFLTSMQSKTVFDEAKLTMPFTYLLKPFNVIELQYSVELAIEKCFNQENTLRSNATVLAPNYLFVKKQQVICKVNFADIIYIEVDENYCTLFTTDQKFVVKKSLSKIKEILCTDNFEQIHRKIMINIDKISQINLTENTIYLSSNYKVSISERYKKQFAQRFNIIK